MRDRENVGIRIAVGKLAICSTGLLIRAPGSFVLTARPMLSMDLHEGSALRALSDRWAYLQRF